MRQLMDKTITIPEISQILKITSQMTGVSVRELDPKLKEESRSKIRGATRHIGPEHARLVFESRGFHFPKLNICFHCLKGGASKTTLACNCAYRLSQFGARVLLVDLDKQANATHTFGVDRPKKVFFDVITGDAQITDVIVNVSEYLDILPSSLENARLELELINIKKNPQTFYNSVFSSVRNNYDIIILDLPPDLNHNTYLSTIFSNIICIPTNPDEYSVEGMKMTLNSIEGIQSEFENLKQEVYVIWSKYDARERKAFEYLTQVKDVGKAKILPVVVRTDSTFKNAQAINKTIFQMKKSSSAREDIDLLSQELIGIRQFFEKKIGST